MKKLIILLLVFSLAYATACADGWWNDWRDDRYEDRYDYSSDYEEGYDEGYNEGFNEGIENPFFDDDDKAGAFGEWFLYEEWSEQELHAWQSVFEALFDGLDRSPYPRLEVTTPVYIAYISGSTYHKSWECSYLNNAYDILELDEAEAIDRGFTLCGRCNEK